MYRKILVPLDGSETSEAVLPHVAALAQCTGAKVILLRVTTQPMYETVFGDTVVTHHTTPPAEDIGERAHADGYLQRIAFDYFDNSDRVAYEVCGGPIAETILDYASGIEADVIAMSTHGRSGLARMVIGSVADEVVRRSHLPVLLVHPDK